MALLAVFYLCVLLMLTAAHPLDNKVADSAKVKAGWPCPPTQTLCSGVPRGVYCCEGRDAVCCSVGSYCCPQGTKCNGNNTCIPQDFKH